jgi:hypothetical protein
MSVSEQYSEHFRHFILKSMPPLRDWAQISFCFANFSFAQGFVNLVCSGQGKGEGEQIGSSNRWNGSHSLCRQHRRFFLFVANSIGVNTPCIFSLKAGERKSWLGCLCGFAPHSRTSGYVEASWSAARCLSHGPAASYLLYHNDDPQG